MSVHQIKDDQKAYRQQNHNRSLEEISYAMKDLEEGYNVEEIVDEFTAAVLL